METSAAKPQPVTAQAGGSVAAVELNYLRSELEQRRDRLQSALRSSSENASLSFKCGNGAGGTSAESISHSGSQPSLTSQISKRSGATARFTSSVWRCMASINPSWVA